MKKNTVNKYLVIFLITILLYVLSIRNFLLFHSIVEIYSIAIAAGIFIVAINTKEYSNNESFIFLGIIYLLVATVDFFHTFTYKGIEIFGKNVDYPTQLWIIARMIESTGLLLFIFYKKVVKYIDLKYLSILYSITTVSLIFSVIEWEIFPTCFVIEKGQTTFKILIEYIICTILLIALYFLSKNKDKYDKKVLKLIQISIILTIISELFFTLYTDVYGFFNVMGHLFKVWSFYLIYRSVIANTLQRPYSFLYRELNYNFNKTAQYLDIAGSIILVINYDQIVEVINKKGEEILNLPKEKIIGKNWFENFVSNTEKDFQLTFFRNFLDYYEDSETTKEYHILTSDNKEKLIRWNITKIFSKDNNSTGMLLSGNDITGQKEYMQQLKKAKEIAELEVKSREKLLRIIGHDIKNSFFSIKGLSDLIIMSCNNCVENTKKNLDMLSESVKSGLTLLDDLLVWSKTLSKKTTINIESINLYELIETVVYITKTYAIFKKIDIKHNVNEDIFVKADENMISTVIRNLFFNAIKYCNDDGKIIVSYDNYDENNILISVKDNGIGMPEKELQFLFKENDVKVKEGTSGEKGTGLGLTLCKDFITLNKGKIWVESELKKGTTFYFTLPKSN